MAQPPQDRGNPLKIPAYTFVPVDADPAEKYPLLVFVHAGRPLEFFNWLRKCNKRVVNARLRYYRSRVQRKHRLWPTVYRYIDYGGLENEDVWEGRNWMIENNPLVDPGKGALWGGATVK